MEHQQNVRNGRFAEIDALRGLAVLLMVFNHGLQWAYTETAYDIVRLFNSVSLGDIATPMFYLAAGLSLYFALQNHLHKNSDPSGLRKRYTIRLSKLLFIGICMSLGWGVLQAQATTLLVLAWLALYLHQHKGPHALHSLLPYFILFVLSVHLLISYSPSPSLENIFSGQFPLFAILTINATGFYLAPRLRLRSFSVRYIMLGIGLIGSALFLSGRGFLIIRYGASFPFLLLGIGLSILILGLFRFNLIQKMTVFHYLTRIGRDSLFLYIFHYVVFFLPFYFSGLIGQMSATGAILFSGTMTILIIITGQLRQYSSFTVYGFLDTILATVWTTMIRLLGWSLNNFLRPSYSQQTGKVN